MPPAKSSVRRRALAADRTQDNDSRSRSCDDNGGSHFVRPELWVEDRRERLPDQSMAETGC